MTTSMNEETPLLQLQPRKPTPLPWSQFTIVMLLQVSEPLTIQVIAPFTPQLIRDIGITDGNESKVGYYVGLLQCMFFLSQAATVLHWSRISDHVGRKPVVLLGLFGLTLSMLCFGVSKTFWTLVLSRCLNGALNGNVGIIKSMMAELTDSTNIAQAYAYMPIAWSTGGAVGPIIGGFLSHPAERFPRLFGSSAFLKNHPYFLACTIPAAYCALIWLIALLFLKDTHRSPLSISCLLKSLQLKSKPTAKTADDPQCSPTAAEAPLPLRGLLTSRVLIAAGNYASIAMLELAFRTIQPLFLSTPIALGGLGLSPRSIGKILSIYGVSNGVFQMLFFARIHNRFGSKMTFMAGILCAVPCFLAFPIISHLAKSQGLSLLVWSTVALQTSISIGMSLSFGAVFIFIAAAAPNRASLGTTNGLSQTTVSLMRAFGPAAATVLFSLCIERDYLGGYLVYYALTGVVGLAVYVASLLPQRI